MTHEIIIRDLNDLDRAAGQSGRIAAAVRQGSLATQILSLFETAGQA